MRVRIEAQRHGKDTRLWLDDTEVSGVVSFLELTIDARKATDLTIHIIPEVVEVVVDDVEVETTRKVLLKLPKKEDPDAGVDER